MAGVVGAKQIFTSCTAAAPDVGEPRTGTAVIGIEEGGNPRGRAAVG